MPWNNIIQNAKDQAEDYSPSAGQLDGSFLENWLMPGQVQQREFGQQVALQEMQNQWNSEAERMARMKEAGINVNTAASGISGAGASPSTGSPNSAIGAGAQGVASAAQAAGTIGDLLNSGVNAYEKITKTPVEVEQSRANIRNLLSSALHNDWLAYSISEMLPLQKANERADTYLKMANFDKAREEKLLINKRISEVEENIGVLKEQARLYHEQGDLVKYQETRTFYEAEQARLDADKKQWDKDWREKYKFDPNSPVDVALEQAMVNGAGDEIVNVIGESVKSVSYGTQKGYNQAEIEDAYNKFAAEFKAKADVDAEFAPYFAAIEANKQQFIELIKMISENPSNLKGLVAKFANLLSNIGSSISYDNSPVAKATKPATGFKSE